MHKPTGLIQRSPLPSHGVSVCIRPDAATDLEARVVVLERTVERLRQALDERSGDNDARRLRCIADTVRGHVFSAKELHNHASVNPDLRAAVRGLSTPVAIRSHEWGDTYPPAAPTRGQGAARRASPQDQEGPAHAGAAADVP